MQLIEPIIKVLSLISTKIILFDYCQITLSHLKYTWMRDASDYAIGGVLVQQGNPVAYESKSSMRLKGMVQEKDMLAIVHYLRTWRWVTICGQHE